MISARLIVWLYVAVLLVAATSAPSVVLVLCEHSYSYDTKSRNLLIVETDAFYQPAQVSPHRGVHRSSRLMAHDLRVRAYPRLLIS